jgi:hypothetical protein
VVAAAVGLVLKHPRQGRHLEGSGDQPAGLSQRQPGGSAPYLSVLD